MSTNFPCLVTAMAFAVAAVAAQAETLASADALLDGALGEIRAKGVQSAVREFNRGGKWSPGNSFLVLADFDGRVVVHSANPHLTGSNMLQAKDAAGRPFMQEALAAAREKGEGRIAVRWGNPKTRRIADGTLVVRRVPGQDLYIASLIFP